MDKYFFVAIILCGVFVFILSLFTNKIEMIINFICRILLGGLGIYFLNIILENQGLQSGVGINGVTLMTIGVLGLPGFVTLYMVSTYYHFT